MANYTLEWTIDWDADSPKEAAQEVVRQFFGNLGMADHFTVTDQETGETFEVNAFSGPDDDDEDNEEAEEVPPCGHKHHFGLGVFTCTLSKGHAGRHECPGASWTGMFAHIADGSK